MKTLITVVRHGETEWNVAMRLQGNQDSPLTANGRLQIEKVATSLKSRSFDLLLSSDLGRAIETAKVINIYHQLEITRMKEFRERSFGVMEGLNLQQIKERYPDVHGGYTTRSVEFQVPEGESLVQFSKRVIDGLKVLVKQYEGKRILLIAHGGVLDCLFRMILALPLGTSRSFSVYNAAINTVSFENNHWKLEEWGNIDHFSGVLNPRDELINN